VHLDPKKLLQPGASSLRKLWHEAKVASLEQITREILMYRCSSATSEMKQAPGCEAFEMLKPSLEPGPRSWAPDSQPIRRMSA
jgi:hypothetical protein